MKKFFFWLLILLVVIIVAAVGWLYFFSGEFFCLSEDDCVQPRCLDCRNICIHHQCTFVQCQDHGTPSLEKGCVCYPGYTGQYCEIKIAE